MAVIETSDVNLIFDILKNQRVVLKYHTDSCGELCLKLKVIFDELSGHEEFSGIKFLRINADDNPIAAKHIREKKQPIMNIYYNGDLIECRTVGTKERIKELLEKLANLTT